MGVGVAGEDLIADEVLNKSQGPAAGGVVRISDAMWAVGAVHNLVVTDDGVANGGQERWLRQVLRSGGKGTHSA